AYNTTPEEFGAAWRQLREHLRRAGKDPDRFPNALATVALYITEEPRAAQRMLHEILGPVLHRPAEDLRRGLLVGSAEECAETLRAYRAAGVQRVLLMPASDGFRQLALFCERVLPLVGQEDVIPFGTAERVN